MSRTKLILGGAALFILFLGVMTYMMLGQRKNRVEVCMTFEGRSACKIASGETRDDAVRTATDNACALIAFGVTDNGQCGRSRPASVKWLD
jgi:hypothetical protein